MSWLICRYDKRAITHRLIKFLPYEYDIYNTAVAVSDSYYVTHCHCGWIFFIYHRLLLSSSRHFIKLVCVCVAGHEGNDAVQYMTTLEPF